MLKVCVQCGTTWDEVLTEKRVGCVHCYEAFSKEIKSLKALYFGKGAFSEVEPPQQKKPENSGKLLELKERLTGLIQQERFEEASKLKDEIYRLSEHGSH